MATNILLSKPSLTGTIRETAFYNPMTIGQTSPILLIGHSDALEQQTPYRVNSMREAINWLGANQSSPLLRALLEAYNSGCRDIYLFSIAEMSEYISDLELRSTPFEEMFEEEYEDYLYGYGGGYAFGFDSTKNFYELYASRLEEAYNILKYYDSFEVVVPVEVSLVQNSGVDFATPLAQFCQDVFDLSGNVMLGVIGTRATAYNQDLIDTIVADSNLQSIGEKGRHILPVWGEGVMVHNQMSATYTSSYSVLAASLLCTTPLTRSIFGLTFPIAASIKGLDLKDSQIEQLAQAKINPVIRTQRGKRGMTFQTTMRTDNSLALNGSDFWSMNQMRTLAECINSIRRIGNAYIGTTASANFKQVVRDYFKALVNNGFIKDYSLDISLSPANGRATVTAGIMPNFGIRQIYFTVETGPGS